MEFILKLTEEEVLYLVDLLDDRNFYLFKKRRHLLGFSSKKTVEYRSAMIDREENLLKSIFDKI